MAPRYFSKEWVEEVNKKVNADQVYLRETKGFTAKNLFIVTDCPDGKDVKLLWEFNKGKVVGFKYEAAPAPSNFRMDKEKWDPSISLFRAQASYDTYVKIGKKELTPIAALGAKLYMIEGDLVKIMASMGYSNAFAKVQASVLCEY